MAVPMVAELVVVKAVAPKAEGVVVVVVVVV
jgi:hypothetical protein